MKKIVTVLILLFVTVVLFGCNPSSNGGTKVALIGSAAGLNDRGYNQSAVEGLRQAAEQYDIEINTVDIVDASAIPQALERFGQENYALVFTLEYSFTELITSYNGREPIAERYPNTTYVIFNAYGNTDESGLKIHNNVIEILFNVNESSFLAGALAVLVNENKDTLFTDARYQFSDENVLGFIGGTSSEGITVFSYGFYQGANYIANELNVNYGILETYDAGFAASTENALLAREYYSRGANIIYGVAGPVSGNIRNEAETAGRLMVDVDANQDNEKPGHVLTSVLKNTGVVVMELIKQLIDGNLESGISIYYSLDSGATSITNLEVISQYISTTTEATSKWQEIKDKLEQLQGLIADGTIDVVDAQSGESLDYNTLTNLTFL